MAISSSFIPNLIQPIAFPTERVGQLWYAAYTTANHEKRVAQHLMCRSVQYFLPLYTSVRKWKDRRVELQIPLFPGYVFVQINLRDRLEVLQIPGVASLVGFGGTPTALPETDIDALRATVKCGVRAEPHPFLRVGRRVRVKAGPLRGLEGIVVRKKNSVRLVISLDLIHRAAAVEIEAADLEPI